MLARHIAQDAPVGTMLSRHIALRLALVVSGVLGVSTLTPIESFAAPPASRAQMIEKLAAQAHRALEEGDHERAAALYLGAWEQDNTQTALVFNAARALHMGRRLERAEELYRRFILLPGADAKLIDKATSYIASIAESQADARAAEAQGLAAQGRHLEAAAAWRAAWRLAPGKPIYLLQAARAQRLTANPQSAIADYRLYLRVALSDADREDAAHELALLTAMAVPPAHGATPVAIPSAVSSTMAGTSGDPAPPVAAEPQLALRSPWLYGIATLLDYVAGTAAQGVGVALELQAGHRLQGQTGVVGWMRGGYVLSNAGAATIAGGIAARRGFSLVTVLLGAEWVATSNDLAASCGNTWICPGPAATQSVARARLRSQWQTSPTAALIVDVFAGLGVSTAQAQWGLAFGILLGGQ